MPDTRYLKLRRGSRWSVQVKVPAELKKKVGKPIIERALGTSDLREAKRLRWQHVADIQDSFERLRGSRGLTAAEIEREAQRVYRGLLEDAEEARQRGEVFADAEPPIDPENGAPIWPTRELAGLNFCRDLLRDGLSADEDWAGEVKEDARQIIKDSGAEIPENSDGCDDLCSALTRTTIEAIGAIMAQRIGKLYVPPQGPFHTGVLPWQLTAPAPVRTRQRSSSAQSKSAVIFSDAAERFLESRQQDPSASWTQQTCLQAEATFRLFRDYSDDPALSEVTRETAAGYLETNARLHPDYGRSPNTKPFHCGSG